MAQTSAVKDPGQAAPAETGPKTPGLPNTLEDLRKPGHDTPADPGANKGGRPTKEAIKAKARQEKRERIAEKLSQSDVWGNMPLAIFDKKQAKSPCPEVWEIPQQERDEIIELSSIAADLLLGEVIKEYPEYVVAGVLVFKVGTLYYNAAKAEAKWIKQHPKKPTDQPTKDGQ